MIIVCHALVASTTGHHCHLGDSVDGSCGFYSYFVEWTKSQQDGKKENGGNKHIHCL